MTITVNVPTELEAPLQAAAQVAGKDIATFLVDNALRQLLGNVLSQLS